jgi:hypothetical protein
VCSCDVPLRDWRPTAVHVRQMIFTHAMGNRNSVWGVLSFDKLLASMDQSLNSLTLYSQNNSPCMLLSDTPLAIRYTIDTSLSFSSWPKHAKLRYAVERYEAAAQFWADQTEVTEKTILQQTGGRVSKKQLKQLPAAAKGMWKDGKFSNPKSDRSKR